MLTKNLFSKDNPEDRLIAEEDIRRTGLAIGEEQMEPKQLINSRIDSMNSFMKAWGEFFKKAYDIHKQYNVKMWFHIIGLWFSLPILTGKLRSCFRLTGESFSLPC
ncbi:MAG: hypothetical protein QXS51_02860 [Thermoproteota archaeon]|nr:hypothetical protein [Candidatus Brockarchaeota archaeon]